MVLASCTSVCFLTPTGGAAFATLIQTLGLRCSLKELTLRLTAGNIQSQYASTFFESRTNWQWRTVRSLLARRFAGPSVFPQYP